MKKYVSVILVALAANCTFAQTNVWKMTLNVVDENGNPIAGANAGVGYYTHSQPASIDGQTDTNGIFVAERSVEPSLGGYALGFGADKAGYYSANESQLLPPTYNPEKWNQTVTLVLRKIGNPIAMYARSARIQIPDVDKAIGFDLVESDWVAPYGKGKQSDIIFETHRRWVSRRDFDSTLKVTFSNAADGLLVAPTLPGNGSRVPVTAPVEGYTSGLQRELSNTSTGWKDDSNKDQNYYLRVRTMLDASGNVQSALYGKIYGDFILDPINSKTTWVLFTYYLNPTPNDRNVEFDPKHNLLNGLQSFENVSAP